MIHIPWLKPICWLSLLISLIGCDQKPEIKRPRDPWVFRSVLDEHARMVTVALHDELYVAYDAKDGSLYKAWKGGVNFDGAVYTAAHGPQPSSEGYAYYKKEQKDSEWIISKEGKELTPQFNFKGYRIQDNQVTFHYTLSLGDTVISVKETPEYVEEDGKPGLWRKFQTENVPPEMQVFLVTSLTSMEDKDGYETTGDFLVDSANIVRQSFGETTSLFGTLKFNSNGETDLKTWFHPGMDSEQKTPREEVDEEENTGQTLIENSDCKSCHNETKKTVGPAYLAVAERYGDSQATIDILAKKVVEGGSGNWGEAVMNAHPDLKEEEAKLMVSYILALDGEEDEDESITLGIESIPLNLHESSERVPVQGEESLYRGLAVNLYSFENRDVPFNQISEQFTPIMTGVAPAIHVTSEEGFGPLTNNIYLEFKGYLQIKETNNYLFRLISDDGAFLYINGDEIINNGGDHGAEAKDGEIFLREGLHEIEINYHQGAGGGMISFQWMKHGSDKFSLVEEILVHKKEQFIEVAPYVPADKLVRSIPGDGKPLQGVHPSFDLAQARPPDFQPRVGGMDFLTDGRMVLCTWDSLGPVYLMEGVTGNDPAAIKVKRIASGLAEPLGIKVVDDQIYVLQKQELTQLIDHDGDDVIDEYRTICDGWKVSANFHEFAFGLVYQDGFFYAALATAIEPGGASTNPQIPDRGKVLKIDKESGDFEFVAHGLRTPNGLGMGIDGEIFIADNQGDWLPANKLVHLQQGAFYGSRSVDFEGTANLEVTPPVVWLPQDEIGNSPSQPTYLDVGPYQEQLIHGDVTHGGLKRTFIEKVNGQYQGAVFRFTQGLEAGINRLAWGPDGSLYVGGVGSTGNWVHAGKLWYGLQKLKYNNKSTFEMLEVSARSNGMEITLTAPIRKRENITVESFEVKQWYYQPTADYGGPKMDLKDLDVSSVHLSDDRRKIFLELEGMKPEHLIYIRIAQPFISQDEQSLWSTEAWYTLNQIPENKPGFSNPVNNPPANTLTADEKAAGWQLLFDGKTTQGWRTFKSDRAGSAWKVADGMLFLDNSKKKDWQTANGGDIITNKEYENFELTLEWKGVREGNSGVVYHVSEEENTAYTWETGQEMQLLDNVNHPDGRIEKHRSGDLYDLIESDFVSVREPGEWNTIRIISKDGHIEHWQNGYKIVEYEMHTPEWEEMIKNSKFKDMPAFGKASKGHIALQDHGDKIWFRNIKIREL